ncbi:MAG: pyridoxal phosphate-dependent aminotransferase [Ferruginibacter sp.]
MPTLHNSPVTTANRLQGVEEYYFSAKLREIEQLNQAGKNIINLGIGSPDLPPHPEVIEVLHNESLKPNQHAYQSYKGSLVLRKAIANWYKRWYQVDLNPDTEILPLMGSKEGIMHICMTFINPGDLVLVPNPGYPTYQSAAKIAGATIASYTLDANNHWYPDFEELLNIIQTYRASVNEEQANRNVLLFVNYPHMPTGQLPTEALFQQLIQFALSHRILLIHDNPYSFIMNDKPLSIMNVPGAMETAIELNSLSKSHNMAGWRIGMTVGSNNHIHEILRFKSNMDSGMFLPVQLAAAKALELEAEFHDEVNTVYADRKYWVKQLLQQLGCTFQEDQAGMFVWAAIPNTYADGYALSDDILYKAGVFITPGGIFGTAGNQYVRVSLCSSVEKIKAAVDRIQAIESVVQ